MKLTKCNWKEFMEAVQNCERDVYLRSVYGDCYNLKSELSAYVAIAEIVHNHNEDLELFCDSKTDEYELIKFFRTHPEML